MSDLKYANGNIKLLLSFKRWTQADLCKKTGITPVTLRRRLSSNPPSWSMLEGIAISKALGIPVEELFFKRMVPSGNEGDAQKGA